MSFRRRLALFFTIIVVIPMIAVAVVLFHLTGDSETGKADAEIAQGMRSAFAVYDAKRDDARDALDAVQIVDACHAPPVSGARPVQEPATQSYGCRAPTQSWKRTAIVRRSALAWFGWLPRATTT